MKDGVKTSVGKSRKGYSTWESWQQRRRKRGQCSIICCGSLRSRTHLGHDDGDSEGRGGDGEGGEEGGKDDDDEGGGLVYHSIADIHLLS